MKRLLLVLPLLAAIACTKESNDSVSSPWDNTSWIFKGSINAVNAVDPESEYAVSFPDGFSLEIQNANEGKFSSDWPAWSKMELTQDGNIRFYYHMSNSQVMTWDDEKITVIQEITEETIITRVDDRNATAYFSHIQSSQYKGGFYDEDEENSNKVEFSGSLKGERIK